MICFITLRYVTEKIFFSSFYVLPKTRFSGFFCLASLLVLRRHLVFVFILVLEIDQNGGSIP